MGQFWYYLSNELLAIDPIGRVISRPSTVPMSGIPWVRVVRRSKMWKRVSRIWNWLTQRRTLFMLIWKSLTHNKNRFWEKTPLDSSFSLSTTKVCYDSYFMPHILWHIILIFRHLAVLQESSRLLLDNWRGRSITWHGWLEEVEGRRTVFHQARPCFLCSLGRNR